MWLLMVDPLCTEPDGKEKQPETGDSPKSMVVPPRQLLCPLSPQHYTNQPDETQRGNAIKPTRDAPI